jgi:hypothetical protein
MDQPVKPNKPKPEAVWYFIQNAGKAIINLFQEIVPGVKRFDAAMHKIGTEANKLNQPNKSKKRNKPLKPKNKPTQPVQPEKPIIGKTS